MRRYRSYFFFAPLLIAFFSCSASAEPPPSRLAISQKQKAELSSLTRTLNPETEESFNSELLKEIRSEQLRSSSDYEFEAAPPYYLPFNKLNVVGVPVLYWASIFEPAAANRFKATFGLALTRSTAEANARYTLFAKTKATWCATIGNTLKEKHIQSLFDNSQECFAYPVFTQYAHELPLELVTVDEVQVGSQATTPFTYVNLTLKFQSGYAQNDKSIGSYPSTVMYVTAQLFKNGRYKLVEVLPPYILKE